ncbi:peptide-binding protein [candidate division CSSED10-310 bacterium]|uniref:Peptide-binding protein n=1 Tax=candidate division CSSED10-310 bacterium TaxID=2855610 RepID=A0ABV6Z2I2_UNCC1
MFKLLIMKEKARSLALRRPIFILLMVIFCTFGCAQKVDKELAKTKKKITRGAIHQSRNVDTLIRELSSDPQYLNPLISTDYNSMMIERLVFDPLIYIDDSPQSKLVGRLAEKWKISDDKLTITFFLRQGITWHDGEPFTAEDVKFTFDMALNEDIPAVRLKSIVEPLDRIEIVNPQAVSFHFKYPFSPGLSQVGTVFIVPKHRLQEKNLASESERRNTRKPVTVLSTEFNRKPIGTGPYHLTEWKTAQHIKLTKNEDYWDKQNQPQISKILFKIIPNRTVAFNILRKGDLDILRTRSIHYLSFLRMKDLHDEFLAEKFYEPAYYFIGWNLRPERKFFSDKRVRRAMTHALDRHTFIEKADYGLGRIITGPFYFKSWAYNPTVRPLPYDLEKAVDLLHAAGWYDHDGDGFLDKDGLKFDFELLIASGSPTLGQLATIVQANLRKLSISCSIRIFEWSVYLERIHKGEFDAFISGWGLGVDPDPYNVWHSSQINSGNNSVAYANEEVDKLLDEGRREFNRQKRQKIYWKIHEIIHNDQPYTFVYASVEKYIMSKRIKNYKVSPFGLFDFFPGQLAWNLKDE